MDGIASIDDPVNQIILAPRRLSSAFAANNCIAGEVLGLEDNDFAVPDALNQEGPRTSTELVRRMRTHMVTMTGTLAWLEGGGRIERHPDSADHQLARIHVVEAGRLIEVYFRINEELAEYVLG